MYALLCLTWLPSSVSDLFLSLSFSLMYAMLCYSLNELLVSCWYLIYLVRLILSDMDAWNLLLLIYIHTYIHTYIRTALYWKNLCACVWESVSLPLCLGLTRSCCSSYFFTRFQRASIHSVTTERDSFAWDPSCMQSLPRHPRDASACLTQPCHVTPEQKSKSSVRAVKATHGYIIWRWYALRSKAWNQSM